MAVVAWLYALYLDDTTLLRNMFVPLSFLGLGMLIKYGDQAFDENVYSKRKTLLLALPGGLWMGSLIAVDEGSATIFAGVLIALLFARKYDNLAFQVGFGAALLIGAVGILSGIGTFEPLGVVIVLIAAFVDERTNDLPGVDGGTSWKAVLLQHRPFLKITVLVLCLVGMLPSLMYFFAFLAFDFGYVLVEALSMSKGATAVG
jgi:hypothetical protein